MKRTFLFILILAALSAFSGYLMSQMSWIGRVGISLIHQEYQFLKVWWQGGAVVFLVLLFIFLMHTLLHRALKRWLALLVHILLLLVAIGGMAFTYHDFDDDFTHSILKQRFHIGAYLFWVSWMLICIFFLTKRKHVVRIGTKIETVTVGE